MAESSSTSKKGPGKLYQLCLYNLVNYLQKSKCSRDGINSLPDSVLLDVYIQMLREKTLCILGAELSDLNTFERLLRYSGAQCNVLQCFQAVIEHGSKLPLELSKAYISRCDAGLHNRNYLINLGLRLGGFLNEAGWYGEAEQVLMRCRLLCQTAPPTTYYTRLTLECCHRLLNTQSAYCCLKEAAKTYALSLELLGMSERGGEGPGSSVRGGEEPGSSVRGGEEPGSSVPLAPYMLTNTSHKTQQTDGGGGASSTASRVTVTEMDSPVGGCAVEGMDNLLLRLYKEFSALFFVRCDYNAAYKWSMHAFKLLKPDTPPRITVEVLRTCGKACVVKRQFSRAGELLRQAVALSRRVFGSKHPRYAAALLDYGFFLLNIDTINQSVAVYEEALAALRRVFGRSNLHVATAQEDLAYALYVLEYSSGRFYKARDHAERAIKIIENLVPEDHLLLASAKRVKALILEEIALDNPAGQEMSEPTLLQESEALHKAALNLSKMAFGEKNVQTAKHYGNLGRLYQSMQKFQAAEEMHLKAIAIKEELLGTEDFEVGLSIGHLASLYNYHMHQHLAAEKLYFRSIAISLKLFGEKYSGLEYDYRGLVHVFTELKKHDLASFYNRLLHHWHELREQSRAQQQPAIGNEQVWPLEELKAKFFNPTVE